MNTEKFNPVFYLWAGSVKTGHMVAELLNKHGLCVEETEFPLVKCSDGEKRDLFQVPEKIFAELETAESKASTTGTTRRPGRQFMAITTRQAQARVRSFPTRTAEGAP